MSQLAVGKAAPTFTLPSSTGKQWKLAAAKGKHLVLYFYPRDNTTGCSTEASEFRDLYTQFNQAGTAIVGISADSLAAHQKFIAKLTLPFELLADEDHTICRLFAVYKEKTLYGRNYLGIERSTFLIDRAGKLREEWRKVKVAGHAAAVLAAAQQL